MGRSAALGLVLGAKMESFWPWTVVVLLLGLGDLVAIGLARRAWRYLFKPGTMVSIIGFAMTALATTAVHTTSPTTVETALRTTALPWSGYLVVAGLLFSVLGDIFLVLPSDRFVAGLSSFFLAHLCYIAAFGLPLVAPAAGGPLAVQGGLHLGDAALAIPILGYVLLFFHRLRPGLLRQGKRGLLLPVALYASIIGLMLLSAWLTRQPLLLAGALLFTLSDSILAWNRFVRPFGWADLAVMTTYFSAQYLFALSLVP